MVLDPSPPSVEAMSEMKKDELDGVCYGTAMVRQFVEIGSLLRISLLCFFFLRESTV